MPLTRGIAAVTIDPDGTLLDQTDLAPSLDLAVSGDTVARKKPDPMPLDHNCAAFALAPADVPMIGDWVNDALAARATGCPVLCVSYGYNEGRDVHELDCDAIVGSLSEAADILQGIRS